MTFKMSQTWLWRLWDEDEERLLQKPQTILCLAQILFAIMSSKWQRIYARQQPVLKTEFRENQGQWKKEIEFRSWNTCRKSSMMGWGSSSLRNLSNLDSQFSILNRISYGKINDITYWSLPIPSNSEKLRYLMVIQRKYCSFLSCHLLMQRYNEFFHLGHSNQSGLEHWQFIKHDRLALRERHQWTTVLRIQGKLKIHHTVVQSS